VRVYRYGLLPPTAGEATIATQCDLAWRFACALFRLNEAYRQAREARATEQPHAAPLREEWQRLKAGIDEDRTILRQLGTGKPRRRRPRSPADEEAAAALRQRIRERQARRKDLWPQVKAERGRLREAGYFAEIDAAHHAALEDLRHRFVDAGLFWGQQLLVEQAEQQRQQAGRDGRPPQRWDVVGIQIQAASATTYPPKGLMPVGAVQATKADPRVWISPQAQPVPGRRGAPLPRLRLRISAAGSPMEWAEWPIILHRPLGAVGYTPQTRALPKRAREWVIAEGAMVRWVKVTRTYIGPDVRWEAHITVDGPDPIPRAGTRVLAVRPTFARGPNNSLIVAEFWDASGTLPPFALHPHILGEGPPGTGTGGFAGADRLQSIRDRERDTLITALRDWQAAWKPIPACWPTTLERWQSCQRLRAFVQTTWAQARVDGDESLYAMASRWAAHDAHLWRWARHALTTAIARRDHEVRVRAATLLSHYDILKIPTIEKVNYRRIARRHSAPEQEQELSDKGSHQRVWAAPGRLRERFIQAALARGLRVVETDPGRPEEIYRERPSDAPRRTTARAARFAKRHKKLRDAGAAAATRAPDKDGSEPPLADGGLST
jgi:hypothetical protein